MCILLALTVLCFPKMGNVSKKKMVTVARGHNPALVKLAILISSFTAQKGM